MNYTTLYNNVCRAKGLARMLAKSIVLVYALQAVTLYILSAVADAPASSMFGPALRLALAVAFMRLLPRLFDYALRRIVEASHGAR